MSIALKTPFYADQYAAFDVFERLVTDAGLSGTIRRTTFEVDATRYYFGAVADLERDSLCPHVPPYWDWEDEFDYTFELDPDVRPEIRNLAQETGIVDDLPEDWTLLDLDPGPLSDIDEELLSGEG